MKKTAKLIKKVTIIALILALTVSVLAGCGSEPADESQGGEEMTTLVLGTSADYAPFEFMYPDENGEMVYGGIDIYTAQYIADYMGVELQIENMSFNNLLTSLENLGGLANLNNVYMDYNEGISSISPLVDCSRLVQVKVYGTSVEEVTALLEMDVLVEFDPTLAM